jgi:hypothetical protein
MITHRTYESHCSLVALNTKSFACSVRTICISL